MDFKVVLLLTLVLAGCGSSSGGGGDDDVSGDGGDGAKNEAPQGPGKVNSLKVSHDGTAFDLDWDVQPGVEYDLYYSTEMDFEVANYASYANSGVQVGVSPPLKISLPLEESYFFVVIATEGAVSGEPGHFRFATNRYEVIDGNPAHVRDKITDLVWKRCMEGQTYSLSEETCVGSPSVLSNAQRDSLVSVAAGNWRLPSEGELYSLSVCGSRETRYFQYSGYYQSHTPGDYLSAKEYSCSRSDKLVESEAGGNVGFLADVFPIGSDSVTRDLYTNYVDIEGGTSTDIIYPLSAGNSIGIIIFHGYSAIPEIIGEHALLVMDYADY